MALNRRLRCIPVRICVTGTRGKSSVTRLIASVFREAGFSVCAKTTGSRPAFILPDGKEELIKRKGIPSVLEQKRIVKMAAGLKVQALVIEMMSINPESMFIESTRLLQPQVMVITNTWRDHLEHWSDSRERTARCFAASIPEECTVFIPEEEMSPMLHASGRISFSKIIAVPEISSIRQERPPTSFRDNEFDQNIRLAAAVSDFYQIDSATIDEGINRAISDFGSLKVWSIPANQSVADWYFVSAFAANDPESTQRVLEKLKGKDWWKGKQVIGLLNLRKDRGDRTHQWIDTLGPDAFPELSKLVLLGDHVVAAKRKIQQKTSSMPVFALKKRTAKDIVASVFALQAEAAVVIGMGNMQGAGEALVSFWQQKGKSHVV